MENKPRRRVSARVGEACRCQEGAHQPSTKSHCCFFACECGRRETPLAAAPTPRQLGTSYEEGRMGPVGVAPAKASSALPRPPLLEPPRLSLIAASAFVRLAMLGM